MPAFAGMTKAVNRGGSSEGPRSSYFGKWSAMSASGQRQRLVTILGSTGSIGCNTAELLAAAPEIYAVEALVALRNVEKLAEQAKALKAKFAVVSDETQYRALK